MFHINNCVTFYPCSDYQLVCLCVCLPVCLSVCLLCKPINHYFLHWSYLIPPFVFLSKLKIVKYSFSSFPIPVNNDCKFRHIEQKKKKLTFSAVTVNPIPSICNLTSTANGRAKAGSIIYFVGRHWRKNGRNFYRCS